MLKITNSLVIKQNLLVASLFVTSFEMLKTSIQDKIKAFLSNDASFNTKGIIEYKISSDYQSQVLERDIPKIDKRNYRDYHLFYSSCLWLKENKAIDQNDINDIQQIRQHRNSIVHTPLNFLADDNTDININLLKKSYDLLTKIEKWWVVETEIPVNPDFDSQEIDENQIHSGFSIFLKYLMEIADEEISRN